MNVEIVGKFLSTLPEDAMFGAVAMPTVVMGPPTTTLEP